MRRSKRYQLQQQTRLAVVLSINIHLDNGEEARLLAIPLMSLTPLVMAWWFLQQLTYRLTGLLYPHWWAVQRQVWLMATLFAIGLSALAYGFGLKSSG